MMRRVTGICASYCTRNSPLDLVKKDLYWQKMKGLGSTTFTSTSFDNKEESLSDMNQGCLPENQDNSGKNLNFFLKNFPKTTTTENSIENFISKSPTPTK